MAGNEISQFGEGGASNGGELCAAWVALPYSSGSAPAPVTDEGALAAPRGLNARNIVDIIEGLRPEVERILVEAYESDCRYYAAEAQYARYKEALFFASICGDSSRVVQHLMQQVGLEAEVRVRKGVPKEVAVAADLLRNERYQRRHPWSGLDVHAVTFVEGPGADERYLVDATGWQYLLNLSGAERYFYPESPHHPRAFCFAQRLVDLGQSDRLVFVVDVSSEESRRSSVREIAAWFSKTFRPWLEETVSEWVEPTRGDASLKSLFFRYEKGSFPSQEKLEADLLELWNPTHYLAPNHRDFHGENRFMSIAEMRANLQDKDLANDTNKRLAQVFCPGLEQDAR
jgi:hypothetical protein